MMSPNQQKQHIRHHYTAPVPLRRFLRELGFARKQRWAGYYHAPSKWMVHLFRVPPHLEIGGVRCYETFVKTPDGEDHLPPPQSKTQVFNDAEAAEFLSNFLRSLGYPVDAILRQKRLNALLS